MKANIFFCLLSALISMPGWAQSNKKRPEFIAVSATNSHTVMPYGSFAALFYKEFHPGVEITTGFNWTEKKNHDWFQTFKVGYSYHEFVQHSLMFYTEVGYRHKLPAGFSANVKLGGGYLHSKEDSKVFVLDEKGEYNLNEKFGRSHGMATFAIGAAKQITKNGWKVFMDYQQRFQISFIDAYVPALPVNTIQVGFSLPLRKK